jgi:tRNA G18 (ribose-2'-O)-methylase SpoU
MEACTRRVRLPIHPDVDSLNVGAAAAVAFAIAARPS